MVLMAFVPSWLNGFEPRMKNSFSWKEIYCSVFVAAKWAKQWEQHPNGELYPTAYQCPTWYVLKDSILRTLKRQYTIIFLYEFPIFCETVRKLLQIYFFSWRSCPNKYYDEWIHMFSSQNSPWIEEVYCKNVLPFEGVLWNFVHFWTRLCRI